MKCLYCNKKLEGRSDKLYCDHYCKAAYHYAKNKQNKYTTFFQIVDRQLRNNRKILKHLHIAGFTTVDKDLVLQKGFDPHFFTHLWKNNKGDVHFFCYDYGFLEFKHQSKNYYLLVQWQPYMNRDFSKRIE